MATFTLFFKRIKSFSPLDPERDWIMLLIASMIVFVGVIVWNVWAFDTVVNGGTIGSSVASSSPTFNQPSLDAIHSVFESRATEEAKYTSNEYRYSDPSL